MITLIALIALSTASSCLENVNINQSDLFTNKVIIHGIYKYIDGDRLFYNCGGGTCSDLIVRDRYLQSHLSELNSHWITIEVTRVNSCDKEKGSELTCLRDGGSVFHIVRWVDPNP
jgi:hypothetical protein